MVADPHPEPVDSPGGVPATDSSRASLAGAGWNCSKGAYRELLPPGSPRFSWLRPSVLWASRNDKVARRLGDPTAELRRRWIEQQRARLPSGLLPDFVIDRTDLDSFSFLLVGDPGEGDDSQYATVPPLLAQSEGTDFMVICSDVIYPAGESREYEQKHYRPYKDYPRPIYALPGNHDWYDGLTGFMLSFCGADAPPRGFVPLEGNPVWKELGRRLLWRRPAEPDRAALAVARALRAGAGQQPAPEHQQPGPYWAIDTGPLRIVGLDTGITGAVDDDQLAWLRRVSGGDRPKLLVTGKPLYVDGQGPDRSPSLRAVDAIVRAPEHRYVASIGGDVHNYQRYPVRVESGPESGPRETGPDESSSGEGGPARTIQHLVSGAGGAYMSATHRIPLVDLPGVEEKDFRCYPLRGDSLSAYSRVYDRRFAAGQGLLEIPPDEAAALIQVRLALEPLRASARATTPSRCARLAARVVAPLPGQRGYNPYLSELLDWNDPPMFKSFLRLDVSAERLRIRCFAATGCAEHEQNPPLEDEVEIAL